MPPRTIFFTGFPGFLGSEFLPRVLSRTSDHRAVCLVQDRYLGQAKHRIDSLMSEFPSLTGRLEVVVGDITKSDLGLGSELGRLAKTTTAIFHLAAVYDLAVTQELAELVNVEGTRHVCDFAEACPNLDRLHYVSTCYVSGRHAGIYREADLTKPGQRFNNHYEETKHVAEAVVRTRMAAGLQATIYRPSVVAGDSATGETQKLDGIYFVIRWILRQSHALAVVPILGDASAVTFNVVPRDYVVEAISELSGRDSTIGQCFAIADPEPLTINSLIDRIAEASGRRCLKLRLPLPVAKFALANVPGAAQLMGTPADAAPYFAHPTHYDMGNTVEALSGTSILDWDRPAWFAALVDFTGRNMSMTSEPML